jgi:hypothetical protein
MKKTGLIVVGLAAVLGIIFLSHEKAQNSQEEAVKVESPGAETTKYTKYTKEKDFAAGGVEIVREEDENAKQVAPVEKKPEELSEAVKTLLGLDGKEHNYPELLAAIRMLGKDLSAADVAALRELLTFPNDRFPKMRPIEVNAVKNDVLDRLLKQTELSEGLGLQMAEMASDSGNDPVWRDYCIQFMAPFYERAVTERGLTTKGTKDTKNNNPSQKSLEQKSVSSVKSVDELSAVREAMFSSLNKRSETLAGTALIGLELLSRTHDEFDREEILKKSVEIAADESASSAARLTALRMVAMTENSESGAAAARSLAQTGETVLLRSAAITTLGEVGSSRDRELLDTFALSENKQIAAAARMAIQKMEARK